MNGSFGVFCGVDLIDGTFSDDDSADEHLRAVVQSGEYDTWELRVREVPFDYDLWKRLLDGLRRSRKADQARGPAWNITTLWVPDHLTPEGRDAATRV